MAKVERVNLGSPQPPIPKSSVFVNRKTGRSGELDSVNVPNQIEESKSDVAAMATMPNLNPPFKNPLNKADSQVKQVKDTSSSWQTTKPFKLEEFADNPPYRGEGLLPTDKTIGIRVVEEARIKERNHPAARISDPAEE